MNSLRLWAYSAFTRAVIKPWLRRQADPAHVRAAFEAHAKRMHLHPPFAIYRNGTIGDVPVLWVSRNAVKRDDVLLYFHGGAFVAGSPDTHKHMIADLAGRLGIEAVMPRYRLAPENPFPAAFEDCFAVYRGLLDRGLRADQIVLGGDSAGGALTLALLGHLSETGEDLPQSAFALSPVVDMSARFDSMTQNAKSEVLLIAERFDEIGAMYVDADNLSHPHASPLHADFKRCPPLLLHHCEGEVLRDDTLAMQQKLVALGHDVLVRSFPNAFHVFHIMRGHFPEARAGLDDVVAFIKGQRTPNDN
ncbi:alpha/beta hydrolase [Amylibacter sp. IMCC11727]|uniref:alpha/beta hydrolase n=1 Tax=Amylibacter sp. IMCC11727 TaxID=3039851 RepID=UPI00244E0FCB|nr:alpha/beta hydrolase [Amylibacter sp. IMCC11727]WGI21596.1 alpha/beta hydrolase [Amylibacter sp. IMCC11727]